MSNLNTIEQYNKGTLFPEKYDETYIATKHVQDYSLEIPEKIVEKLNKEVQKKGLFFDNDNLMKDIATGLIRGNIILQGPPGTGKTTLAEIISNVFNVDYEIVTAMSDWTTYDTIGGLQPDVDEEGNEIITGKNGRIVDSIIGCCNTILQKEKYDYDKQASWLFIDELNRSEIDKVFGDLFTVFGSSSLQDKKIPLWFEKDPNKAMLYVPQRYRIIGMMNNIDKNYVYDLSHGLARRFTFINVLPPTEGNFETEVKNIKEIIKNNLNVRFKNNSGLTINNSYIDKVYEKSEFKNLEIKLNNFIKDIRYDGENRLNLQFGTAQIIDLYENIIIRLILDDYLNLDSSQVENVTKEAFDSSIVSRLVPQMEGYDYRRLKDFNEIKLSDESEYRDILSNESIEIIKSLV